MAIPLAPAVVAVISVIGVGILEVVEGDHDAAPTCSHRRAYADMIEVFSV